MNFSDALNAMKQGKKITRPNYDIHFLIIRDEVMWAFTDNRRVRVAGFNAVEVMAEDWMLYDEYECWTKECADSDPQKKES